jgi:tyrosine-protein phosphatase SIW14
VRLRRAAIALLAVLSSAVLAADLPAAAHVPNFGKVNDHLYRGAAPLPEGLKELAAMHILMDIDLREPGQPTESERRLAESLGIKYVNVPFPAMSAPPPGDLKRVLQLISQDDAGSTFVHCRRGKDRTGTVIACYRIEHDGWQPKDALHEANGYGMSWVERGMRSFVLNFKPIDLGSPLPPEK